MAEAPKIWKDTYNVKVYEADAKGRANVTALANYLQNSAWNHYNEVEKALGELLPPGCIWLMTRLEIQIYSMPKWAGDVCVETWSRGIEKLMAFRDYIIYGEDGKTAAKATASWVVVDVEKRRIQKLDGLSKKWPSNSEKSALRKSADRIQELKNIVEGRFFSVKYSDLDLNRHVNNVKYIQWIMDGYEMAFIEGNEIEKFEINFLGEANYGDDLAVNAEKISDAPLVFLHNIIRKNDAKEICRARISYK
jgi:medium-chain acyl-[acyl-carrier-protein] hydrolase